LGIHRDITNNYGDLTNNYGDIVGLIVGYDVGLSENAGFATDHGIGVFTLSLGKDE
jgi:hypothetical protein